MPCKHPLEKLLVEGHEREESAPFEGHRLHLRCSGCAEPLSIGWLKWEGWIADRISGSPLKMADELNRGSRYASH
jgi:hypothetical protein